MLTYKMNDFLSGERILNLIKQISYFSGSNTTFSVRKILPIANQYWEVLDLSLRRYIVAKYGFDSNFLECPLDDDDRNEFEATGLPPPFYFPSAISEDAYHEWEALLEEGWREFRRWTLKLHRRPEDHWPESVLGPLGEEWRWVAFDQKGWGIRVNSLDGRIALSRLKEYGENTRIRVPGRRHFRTRSQA